MDRTPDHSRPIDEEVRRRFEKSWIDGQPNTIEDVLPNTDSDDSVATLEELIHIELEFAWKALSTASDRRTRRDAAPPRVEMYLARFPVLDRPGIVERLAQQEYDVRQKYADQPSIDEFHDRFPKIRIEPAQPPPAAPRSHERRVPEKIASYKILRLLGEGGMGVVYLAEQDTPRRTVALKIIKPGFATPEVIKRFEHEAQVLGHLHHPGIAQVHEAGIHEDEHGPVPFIAMEFVAGEPLDDFCARRNPPVEERLELMVKICDAVQHAHQKGIVHRDLKPSNILVEEGEGGRPKILDFGVARVTDSDLQTTTLRTDVGQLLGTVQYMSPEQAAGDPRELDMRSDIYSLGVILYELLTGLAPYDLRGMLIHEAVRRIREHEPTPAGSVNPAMRGDLSTILSKAMDKEKERRYQSAAELSDDVQRFMNDEPITAHPPSAAYQLRKFARRHRLFVGSAAAVAAALLIGTGLALWQAVRATDALAEAKVQRDEANAQRDEAHAQRDEALRQTKIAQEITEFLNYDLLGAPNPQIPIEGAVVNRDIPILTLVRMAARNLDGRFPDQPIVEASIRNALGFTFSSLGEFESAETQYKTALELERGTLSEDDPLILRTKHHLASLYSSKGRETEAEQLFKECVSAGGRVLGEDDRATLVSKASLASMYYQMGRGEEALQLLNNVLERQTRTLGEEHLDTIATKNILADCLKKLGRITEAEELTLEVFNTYTRLFGNKYSGTLEATIDLAIIYADTGRLADAEALLSESLTECALVLGSAHPWTLRADHTMGMIYAKTGRQEEAIQLLGDTLEKQKRVLGDDHVSTVTTAVDLASIHGAVRNVDDAVRLFETYLEPCRRVLGIEHHKTLLALANLASVYQIVGRIDEAIALHEEAFEIRRRVHGPDHVATIVSESNLGEIYLNLQRDADAEPHLASSALSARKNLAPGHEFRGLALFRYGLCLHFLKRHTEAENLLLDAYDSAIAARDQGNDAQTGPVLDLIVQVLVKVYVALDDEQSAAEWRAKLPDGN